MTETTQIHKIKCPYCGWVTRMSLRTEAGMTIITAGGLGDWLKAANQKLHDLGRDQALEQANACWVMPPCPNPDRGDGRPCGQTFEYNWRTCQTHPQAQP